MIKVDVYAPCCGGVVNVGVLEIGVTYEIDCPLCGTSLDVYPENDHGENEYNAVCGGGE